MTAASTSAAGIELSRFLVEHESCGRGFDFPPPGGEDGGLTIACRGCGEVYTRTAPFRPTGQEEAAGRSAGTAPGDPELEEGVDPEGTPAPPPLPPPRSRRGRRRDRLIVAGLLAFAAAALAFAVLRVAGDRSGGSEGETAATAAPPAQRQAGRQAPPAQRQARPAGRQASPARRQAQQGQRQRQAGRSAPRREQAPTRRRGHAPTTLPAPAAASADAGERLLREPHFSLVIPADWAQGTSAEGALVASPPGAEPAVSVEVFNEYNPSLDMASMEAGTATFLREHSGGGAAAARRLRFAGQPAFAIRSRGSRRSSLALGLLAGGYRFLVVSDQRPGATAAARRLAARVAGSFRPR